MELNKKTIDILLRAVKIAKEITQIEFSQNQVRCRVNTPEMTDEYLAKQSVLIDSMDDYEWMAEQLDMLKSRPCYQPSEE